MRIRLSQFSLGYDQAGSGLPLVFIHGYPLSRRLWAAQVEALSAFALVMAVDLRGHGDSDPVPGPYSMEALADDILEFLQANQIHRPFVACGLSMGGYVALALARRHPEQLAGLILTATRAAADSPETRLNRDKAAALARQQGVQAIVESMLPRLIAARTYGERPHLLETLREIMQATSLEGVLGDLEGMKTRPDSTAFLPDLHLPVLILHGAEDQLIPLREAQAMQAALPQAHLEVIPGAGHLPNLEQPERFNQAVRRYLAGLQEKN